MWKNLLFCGSLLITAGSAQTKPEIVYTDEIAPANMPPAFDNGRLAVYGLDPAPVYAPDGNLAYKFRSQLGTVTNVAFDTDGSAAFASAEVSAVNRGAISIVNPQGEPVRFIETGAFLPSSVCFGADHSLWVIGWQRELPGKEIPEYDLLRHYSPDGRELGRYLPRSSFGEQLSIAVPSIGFSNVRSGARGTGALVGHGRNSVWVEITPGGEEAGRWPAEIGLRAPVMLANGGVYAQTTTGVLAFDRVAGRWQVAAVRVPPNGLLAGAEGMNLIFFIRGENRILRAPVTP